MSEKKGKKKKWGKKYWVKEIWVKKKRVITPKGHKLAAIGLSSFAGGDILKSCAQSKFEAKWLTIALFRTDRTFLDPKLPNLQK